MTTSTPSRWLTLLLFGLTLVMAAEIIYLVIENRSLRASLAEVSRPFEPMQKGSRAPSLSGQDLAGEPISIQYATDAPYTLLYCFSPTCDACEGNVTCWDQAYASAIPESLRCLGLCAGPVAEAQAYVDQHAITYPVMSINDERMWESLHGSALPQTILISPDGTVEQVWLGTLDHEQCLEIFLTLNNHKALKPERASR